MEKVEDEEEVVHKVSLLAEDEGADLSLAQTAKKEDLLASFRWLGWAPPKGSDLSIALDEKFPGAIPGSAVFRRAITVLREFGITKDNTLFGSSICCDEINNEDGDMSQQFRSYFGEVFPLGGLGGSPFTGSTGFSAFSHHVPKNGNMLILFGPHCGLTNEGHVGKYIRHGQTNESTCCGAVSAAFQQINSRQHCAPVANDMQMTWWRQKLLPELASIKASNCIQTALATAAYHSILDAIEDIVHTDFGSGKLILLGGIQLNLAHPQEDHLQPRLFEIHQNGRAPIKLLPELALS